MNSKEYIICKLEKFIEEFSNVRVRYEFDSYSDVHLIEITPNNIYHLDSNYIEWENNLFEDFVGKYPTENICFISDDSYVEIGHPLFEKEGDYYSYKKFVKDEDVSRNIIMPDGVLPSYKRIDAISVSICKLDCNYNWDSVLERFERFELKDDSYLNAA